MQKISKFLAAEKFIRYDRPQICFIIRYPRPKYDVMSYWYSIIY